MPIQTPLYPHAFIVPEAYTLSIVGEVIAGGATYEGPVIVPAAVVNPNTAAESAHSPSAGHILTALMYSTIASPALQANFQFRFPAGSNTWHTAVTVAFSGNKLAIDSALSILYLPTVPNFRMTIFNPGGAAATIEGALTLYSL